MEQSLGKPEELFNLSPYVETIKNLIRNNTTISIDEAVLIIGKQEIEKFDLAKQRDTAIQQLQTLIDELNRLTERNKALTLKLEFYEKDKDNKVIDINRV